MKNIRRNTILFLILGSIIAFSASSCKRNKKAPPVIEEKIVEYPVSEIPKVIMTSPEDNTTLYPVSEDFLRDFILLADRYEGTPAITRTNFPTEWGVLYIERLPEGKELWLLQSVSREWIYLVTTSGMGTQRILDVLPVALNLAVQQNDILEAEVWTTKRDSAGIFVVDKSYEWVKSVANVTKEQIAKDPEAYRKSNLSTDRYSLNEMGRFEFIPQEETPDYNAVVFYYDKEMKPEEWDNVMLMLQPFCEEKNIYFEEAYTDFSNIFIRDFKLNDIVTVDISSFVGQSPSKAGMVMLKKGLEPKNVNFGSEPRMRTEIKRYFKLLNQ